MCLPMRVSGRPAAAAPRARDAAAAAGPAAASWRGSGGSGGSAGSSGGAGPAGSGGGAAGTGATAGSSATGRNDGQRRSGRNDGCRRNWWRKRYRRERRLDGPRRNGRQRRNERRRPARPAAPEWRHRRHAGIAGQAAAGAGGDRRQRRHGRDAGTSGNAGRGGTRHRPWWHRPAGAAAAAIRARATRVAKSFVTPTDNRVHCYWARSNSQTWSEASQSCMQQNGHLVTILSAEENAFVVSMAQFSTSFSDTWIGATDGKAGGDRTGPGTYRWVTNETWGFTSWAQGQPDGFCDPCSAGQTCTCDHRATLVSDGTWTDMWADNTARRSAKRRRTFRASARDARALVVTRTIGQSSSARGAARQESDAGRAPTRSSDDPGMGADREQLQPRLEHRTAGSDRSPATPTGTLLSGLVSSN